MIEAIATHEASHAVVGVAMGVDVRNVTIIPTLETAGCCEHVATKSAVDDVTLAVAGVIGQAKGHPDCVSLDSAAGDIKAIGETLAGWIVQDNNYAPLMTHCVQRAQTLVDEHWPAILRVRDALLAEKRLSGERVRELMKPTKRLVYLV